MTGGKLKYRRYDHNMSATLRARYEKGPDDRKGWGLEAGGWRLEAGGWRLEAENQNL